MTISGRELMMWPNTPTASADDQDQRRTRSAATARLARQEEHRQAGTLYSRRDARDPQLRRRRRRRPAGGRLPARRHRPRWSRSWRPSSASRCWSRVRPASARPSSPRRWRATSSARWCACSATRAWTRPRRCTSGTTASSCCGSRRSPTSTGWEDVQDDIFGEEFLLAAAADDRDRLRRAGRAADRRDRQDRPGVRGDAARAAVRLPDLDPRARADRGAGPSRSCC